MRAPLMALPVDGYCGDVGAQGHGAGGVGLHGEGLDDELVEVVAAPAVLRVAVDDYRPLVSGLERQGCKQVV